MPAVSVTVDPSLDAAKVALAAHAAVKEGIGKPDMYITVGVTSGVVLVGGKPGKVLAHVDSMGGSFAGFVDKFCAALGEMGVAAGEVTCTFRSVSMKEFAMNGAPLG
jgi:hypothetical protein